MVLEVFSNFSSWFSPPPSPGKLAGVSGLWGRSRVEEIRGKYKESFQPCSELHIPCPELSSGAERAVKSSQESTPISFSLAESNDKFG